MPVRARCKIRAQARIEILQSNIVGGAGRMKERLSGRTCLAVVIAQCEVYARGIGNAPAKISGEYSIAEGVVQALAVRFKIGDCGRIIESAKQAGKLRAAVAGGEIAAVRERREFRNARGSAVGENLNHTIHGVRSVERAFRSVDDFNFVDVVEREVGKIDEAA